MMGMSVLLLNSIGRKTGNKRTTPLLYIRDGNNYVVIASAGGSEKNQAWFYNLQSNPQTTIQVRGNTLKVVAEQATPEEKSRLWAQLSEITPTYDNYQKGTSRDIPIIILHPEG